MSDIRPISESEFLNLATGRESIADISWDEKEWYANGSKTILGVVVQDRIDRDWGYVVLKPDDKGVKRAIDQESSLPDMETARTGLLDAMGKV